MVSNIQYRRNQRSAERHAYQNEIHAHLARILMCLFGGISLVAPIIVLVFVKSPSTLTLVLTVVFVLVLALVLPLVCRSSTPNEAMLAATAACAAVLVVFVANASVSVRGS